MLKTFRSSDKVSWNSSQGEIKGTVRKKLTQERYIKSHHVAATQANP